MVEKSGKKVIKKFIYSIINHNQKQQRVIAQEVEDVKFIREKYALLHLENE